MYEFPSLFLVHFRLSLPPLVCCPGFVLSPLVLAVRGCGYEKERRGRGSQRKKKGTVMPSGIISGDNISSALLLCRCPFCFSSLARYKEASHILLIVSCFPPACRILAFLGSSSFVPLLRLSIPFSYACPEPVLTFRYCCETPVVFCGVCSNFF